MEQWCNVEVTLTAAFLACGFLILQPYGHRCTNYPDHSESSSRCATSGRVRSKWPGWNTTALAVKSDTNKYSSKCSKLYPCSMLMRLMACLGPEQRTGAATTELLFLWCYRDVSIWTVLWCVGQTRSVQHITVWHMYCVLTCMYD